MEIKYLKQINKGGVKATGYVDLAEAEVNEIIVKKSDKGVFYDMPGQSYQDKDGKWQKAYHARPLSKEAAGEILNTVKKAVDDNKYRALASDKDKMQLGFVNLTCKNVSVKVSITDDGRIITPSRSYEKNGKKEYVNYVNLSKAQADEIRKAFEAALA